MRTRMGDPSFSEKKCFGLAIRAEKHSAWSGEREPRRLIFKIYIPNLALRSIFNFEIVRDSEKQTKRL